MNTDQPNEINGFCLIEVLLSIAIFSIFLTVIWQTQQSTFRNLYEGFKTNEIQFELNQIVEKMMAYPEWNVFSESDLSERLTIYEYDFYREITLCSKNSKENCFSMVIPNRS